MTALAAAGALPLAQADTTQVVFKAAIHDSSKKDTLFRELHLSSDGVYGVDKNGKEWEYDFSRNTFVPGTGELSKGRVTIPPTVTAPDMEELMKSTENVRKMADSMKEMVYSSRKIFRGLQLGAVEIDSGEAVHGPVMAMGPVTVRGVVDGDVTSYKKITVTSTGVINGDARAPEIVKMRGGVISGQRYETDIPEIPNIQLFRETSYTALIVNVVILAILIFCGFLAVAIVPKPLTRIRDCLEVHPVKSFFIGFAVWILFAPAFALLCLTIVGIPVAIFVLPLGLLVAVILGSIGLGQFVGEKADRHLGRKFSSQLTQAMSGLIILYSAWIVMSLFRINPTGTSYVFSTLFLVLAIVIWSLGVTAGLGAVVYTRFGTKAREQTQKMTFTFQAFQTPTPPTPPPPSPPPLKPDGTI